MKLNLCIALALTTFASLTPTNLLAKEISKQSHNSIEENIQNKNFNKARNQINNSIFPNISTKEYYLARYYGGLAKANWFSNKAIAKKYFAKLVEIFPKIENKDDYIKSDYALALIRKDKNYSEGLEILTDIIKTNPDFGEAYLNSYVANYYIGNYSKAYNNIKIYVDRLSEFEPNSLERHKLYFSLISVGIRSRQPENSLISYYNTFQKISPDDYLLERLFRLGFAAQIVSDSNWLSKISKDLLDEFPGDAKGYRHQINTLIVNKQYKAAIGRNLAIINKGGIENAKFYQSLISLYTHVGDVQQGEIIAKKCIEQYGDDFLPCQYSLATLYRSVGKNKVAEAKLLSILTKVENSKFLHGSNKANVELNVYAGLALIYAKRGENEKAIKYADLSEEIYTPNANTLIARGYVHMNKGENQKAREYFNKGIEIYDSGSHFFPKNTGNTAKIYRDRLK